MIIIIMSSEPVNFKVVSHEDRVFNISPTETINDFRRVLAKELFESDNYVDIICDMKIPIRIFGKLTLEPGKIPASYNDSKLERFGINGRTINIKVVELDTKNLPNNPRMGGNWGGNSGYVPPGGRNKKRVQQYVYNEGDFPPLGS